MFVRNSKRENNSIGQSSEKVGNMKKLMFAAVAAISASVALAAVESANIVG